MKNIILNIMFICVSAIGFYSPARADVKIILKGHYAISTLSIPDVYFCNDVSKMLSKRQGGSELVLIDVNLTDMSPACNHEEYKSSKQRSWHDFINYADVIIKDGSAEGLMSLLRYHQSEAESIYTGTDKEGFKHYKPIIYADKSYDFNELLIPPDKYFSHPSLLICKTPSLNNPNNDQICTLTQLYTDHLFVEYHFNKLFLNAFKNTEVATEAFIKNTLVSQERINSRKIIPFGQQDCLGNVTLELSGVRLRIPRNTNNIYMKGMQGNLRLSGDRHPRYDCKIEIIHDVYGLELNPTERASIAIQKDPKDEGGIKTKYKEWEGSILKYKSQYRDFADGLKGHMLEYYEQYLIPLEKVNTKNREPVFVECSLNGHLKRCETIYFHPDGLYVTHYFSTEAGPEDVLNIVVQGKNAIHSMILPANKD